MKHFALALITLCLVLVSQQAFAWVIDGVSVVEQDTQFSVIVTPHTASSPAKKFTQEFKLCNKTGDSAKVYAAYVFNYALRQGRVEYFEAPAYGWVNYQFTCNYSFVYQLNKFAGQQNPHWAKCYRASDANGYDENTVVFERSFKAGDLLAKTITYDVNELVGGNKWVDITSGFTQNKAIVKEKHIYPYTDGKTIAANSCEKWRIAYTPAPSDKTKKWELWLWVGANWNCILNDTCLKVVKLDPWWSSGSDWYYKKAIYLPNQDINAGMTIRVPVDFTALAGIQADCDDVRVVDENLDVEQDRLIDPAVGNCNTVADGNVYFFLNHPIKQGQSGLDTTYYLYYNNPSATAAPDSNAARTSVCTYEFGKCYTVWESTQIDLNTQKAKFGATSGSTPVGGLVYGKVASITGNIDANYTGWFSIQPNGNYGVFAIDNNAWNGICGVSYHTGGNFYIGGADVTDTGIAYSSNVWYKAAIRFKDYDANCTATIYDASGNWLSSNNVVAGQSVQARRVDAIAMLGDYIGATALLNFDNTYFGPAIAASGLGGAQTAPSPQGFDLNIWRIDGYDVIERQFPSFSYMVDGNITIDFNVWNVDNNAMTVDINYSTSQTQGTGTPIVVDLNLNTAVCANAQKWDVNSVPCVWDWNIMKVVDGNYFILMDLNGGKSRTFSATSKSFRLKQPTLHLQFFDENIGAPLTSLAISFAGKNYSTDASGKVSIPALGLNTTVILSAYEDNNYPTRYFAFDVNDAMGSFDLNLFLLRDGNGQNVSFKFYDTDEATILSNKLVKLRHGDSNLCSMRYTDGSGKTSFFLDPDDNYVFEIVKSETNILRYYPAKLTISAPKDERTTASITPFDVVGKQLTPVSWFNTSSAITYYILANTLGYYSFDFNASGYYSRNYLVSVKGDTAAYSLQAYLAPKTVGEETVSGQYTFIVTDSVSLKPIANVLIIIKKFVPGEGEKEIASITTSSAGTATTSLQYYTEYSVYFYYNGQLVHSASVSPTPTPGYFQVQLPISVTPIVVVDTGKLIVEFKPSNHNLFLNPAGWADINIRVSLLGKDWNSMKITLKDSNGLIIGYSFFTGTWVDGNTVHYDLNLFDFNFNRLLIAVVDVNSTDGNGFKASFAWSVFREGQWEIMKLLADFSGENNKMVTGFIALFITLLAVGAACTTGFVPGDALLLSMLTLFILFFFVFIGFIDIIPVLFIALFVIFAAIVTKAVT